MRHDAELLVNPAAGRGRGRRLSERLRASARAREVPVTVAGSLEELRRAAHRAAHEDFVRRLVVAGGDGTFHHVAQEIAGSDTALGMIPVGSGNDLAAALDVPTDASEAFDAALGGRVSGIDLGRVAGRLFAVYCGLGFDGAVAERNRKLRWLRGRSAYVYSVLRTLAAFQPPVLSIAHENGSFSGSCFMAVVANGPRLGGGMRLAPDARLDDGMLDLVYVETVAKRELLRIFPRVYRGAHLDHPAVHHVRTRWVRVETDHPQLPYADGEPLGERPLGALEIALSHRRLWVASPRGRRAPDG